MSIRIQALRIRAKDLLGIWPNSLIRYYESFYKNDFFEAFGKLVALPLLLIFWVILTPVAIISMGNVWLAKRKTVEEFLEWRGQSQPKVCWPLTPRRSYL